jgi:ABC-type sugar transport system ATPase subunit
MSEAFKKYHGEIQIVKVFVTKDFLTAHLSDERIISIPLKRIPKLLAAFANDQTNQALDFQISASGNGIHWPSLDEDISIKAFL